MLFRPGICFSTLLLFLVLSLNIQAQESIKVIKIGFNYGLGTQQNYPFNTSDYTHDTKSFKGQINYVISSKRKWNFEFLFEPGIYISKHQLLNKYYIKAVNHENFEALRERFTKESTIYEYTLGVGFIFRYKLITNLSPYTLFSVGPSLMSKSTERLDKGFVFSDVFAVGLSYNASIAILDFRLGIRHTSNASLNQKNSGHNSSFIEIGFLFLL